MDLATLISLVGGIGLVFFGIMSSNSYDPTSITMYIDVPSVIITIGGSLICTLGCNKLPDFIAGFKSITLAIKEPTYDPAKTISTIIDLSNVGRKEGLLALEEAANNIEDDFLKKGIMLVVDGTDPELVRGILETDMICMETRHKSKMKFWDKWGEMGPAWGMIGTLVGLVAMLYNMEDASSIGPQMAVALITTFYGSLIANWICNPVSNKLSYNHDMEMSNREITIEGLLSIQAGENPRVIEEKLKSFLAPSAREAAAAAEGAGGGEE